MKKIKNEVTKIESQEKGKFVDYFEIIKTVINGQATKGLTIEGIRKRSKILNKVDKDKSEIELSDDEFNLLKGDIQSMQWSVIHEDIVKFADYIDSL